MCMVTGTNAMEGRGVMLVTAVGPRSQSGIIMSLLNDPGTNQMFYYIILI